MAALFNGLFGGSKPSASPIPAGDSGKSLCASTLTKTDVLFSTDFADFAGAPEPEPAPLSPIPTKPSFTGVGSLPTGAAVPYTKWYNIHERYSLSDFKQEGVILGLILVIVIIHLIGTNTNRKKAKKWVAAHAPVLEKEFALVGFGGERRQLRRTSRAKA